MKFLETGVIASREEIHSDLFQLRIHAPKIASASLPGQFLHIRIDQSLSPLLRRPFSLQRVHGDELEVLVKVYGRGSDKLCALRPGDPVDMLGPLGVTWTIPQTASGIVGVSGGVGIAPILFQQSRWNAAQPFHHLVGARTAKDLPYSDAMREEHRLEIATDDGSAGYHGNVVALLDERWQRGDFGDAPYLITCGPWVMMKALTHWATTHGIRGQFSAEARMACAIGVCQGCAVARPMVAEQHREYLLCCKDGPVFDFGAIDMEVSPFGN